MLIHWSSYKNGRLPRLFLGIATAGVLIASFVLLSGNGHKQHAEQPPDDLWEHPIYATYRFSRNENEIRFGIQPIWIFGGNVGEALARDRILRQELKHLGLTISFYPFLKGKDINFFVRQGVLHGGMVGDMPLLTLAAERDIVPAALIDRGYDYIVANRFMLMSELKGSRIAIPHGSSSHHALLEALAFEGLTEQGVTLVPMDVDRMPEALSSGEIDAFAAWEPVVSMALEKAPTSEVIHRSQWTSFTFFTAGLAREHPAAVRHIIAAQIRAVRWIAGSRKHAFRSSRWALEAGQRLSGEPFGLTAEEFTNMIYRDDMIRTVPVIAGSDLDEGHHLEREFLFLKKTGKIAADADWDRVKRMFDQRIVRSVLKDPARYRLDEFQYGEDAE